MDTDELPDQQGAEFAEAMFQPPPTPLYKRAPVRWGFRLVILGGFAVHLLLGLMLVGGGGFYIHEAERSSLPVSFMPIGLIGVGILLVVLSTLGIASTVFERRNLLFVSVVLAGLAVLCQAVFVVVVAGRARRMGQFLDGFWDGAPSSVRDDLEHEFKCCGYTNATDAPGPVCAAGIPAGWSSGCQDLLLAYLNQHIGVIRALVISALVIQVIATTLAILLARLIPSSQERRAMALEEAWMRTLGRDANEPAVTEMDFDEGDGEAERRSLLADDDRL